MTDKPPTPPSPRVISLDIETYGICEQSLNGHPLPTQSETRQNFRFCPPRALHHDIPRGLHPRDLITSIAFTIPVFDPRTPNPGDQPCPSPSSTSPTPTPSSSGTSTASPSPSWPQTPRILSLSKYPPSLESYLNHHSAGSGGGSMTVRSTGQADRSVLPTASPTTDREWSAFALSRLRPGPSFILYPQLPEHLSLLLRWLRHADTLLFMNAQFDLWWLRTYHPAIRQTLNGDHLIIDLSVLLYLENPTRPERSLKAVTPLLGNGSYTDEQQDRSHRYPSPLHPDHILYNCTDTHTTLTNIASCARRIHNQAQTQILPPDATTPLGLGTFHSKLTPDCLSFYSDTIWSCLSLSETGVPFDLHRLNALRSRLLLTEKHVSRQLRKHNIFISKTSAGNRPRVVERSKAAFFDRVIRAIDEHHASDPPSSFAPETGHPSILNHPLIQLTPKTRRVSFSASNRNLLSLFLPPSSPLHRPLSLVSLYFATNKLLSSYVYPYTESRRNHPADSMSRALPFTPSSPHAQPHPPNNTSTLHRPTGPPGRPQQGRSRTTHGSPSLTPAGLPPRKESHPEAPQASRQRPLDPPTPARPRLGISYPTVFITPSPWKDDQGSSGGTASIRLAMKHGAHNTDPPEIQACYTSRFPGGFLVEADLAQAEVATAGLLSGEPNIIEPILRGEDLHTLYTVQIFGPSVLSEPGFKSKIRGQDKRQVGKTLRFWNLYLGGPSKGQATVMEDTGIFIPLSFFEDLVRRRPSIDPTLYAWQTSVIEHAERTGSVILPFTGQHRDFLNPRSDRSAKYEANEIVNLPIQYLSAAVLLRVQHRCYHRFKNDPFIRPFLNRHDELNADCGSAEHARTFASFFRTALSLETETPGGIWYETQRSLSRTVPLRCEIGCRNVPPSEDPLSPP